MSKNLERYQTLRATWLRIYKNAAAILADEQEEL
jgi:hypothetical protein